MDDVRDMEDDDEEELCRHLCTGILREELDTLADRLGKDDWKQQCLVRAGTGLRACTYPRSYPT
jgi:hypothetical protein